METWLSTKDVDSIAQGWITLVSDSMPEQVMYVAQVLYVTQGTGKAFYLLILLTKSPAKP